MTAAGRFRVSEGRYPKGVSRQLGTPRLPGTGTVAVRVTGGGLFAGYGIGRCRDQGLDRLGTVQLSLN